jgi:amphi-Trp domain-containing protein
VPHHHPHHRHHASPHGKPGPARWFFSAEHTARLAEAATLLSRLGSELANGGAIKLRDDLTVTPPDPCDTVVRFERSPIGELILKIELKWPDGDRVTPEDSLDALIGSESAGLGAESEA